MKNIRDLRLECAALGIDSQGKDRLALTQALVAYEESLRSLRLECVRRGLVSEGSKDDLLLRLEACKEGAISPAHRKAYKAVAVGAIVLGLAALAISLPHIAAELEIVMGTSAWVAFLFAVVIDLGVVSMKLVDTLASKFDLKGIRGYVWSVLGTCLVFSAALNASQFLRHVEASVVGQSLAIGAACFISGFIFLMFYIGSSMTIRCEDRRENEAQDPVRKLKEAAVELNRLKIIADKF
jgi:hypothetical protein